METSIEKITCITIRCDVTRKLGKEQDYKTRYETLIPHLAIKGFLHNISVHDNKESLTKKAIRSLRQHHCAINYYTVKAMLQEMKKTYELLKCGECGRTATCDEETLKPSVCCNARWVKKHYLTQAYFKRIVKQMGLRRDMASGIACFY